MTKPFDIPKQLFVEAFKLVKTKAGAAGVDRQSLEEFELQWKDNLYKLWNRMSSGSILRVSKMVIQFPSLLIKIARLILGKIANPTCAVTCRIRFFFSS